ncbi:hypothetical protein [Nostoc sp.]
MRRSVGILLVTDLFHPIHGFTVEPFLNGDVRHCCGCRSAMPMLLTRLKTEMQSYFQKRRFLQ